MEAVSKGAPIAIKCPKCHRGQRGYPNKIKGVLPTGYVDSRVTRSKQCGHGSGGQAFYGRRGEVECLDCGHRWYSSHPDSGRLLVSPEDRPTLHNIEKLRLELAEALSQNQRLRGLLAVATAHRSEEAEGIRSLYAQLEEANAALPALRALLQLVDRASWEHVKHHAEIRAVEWQELIEERSRLIEAKYADKG